MTSSHTVEVVTRKLVLLIRTEWEKNKSEENKRRRMKFKIYGGQEAPDWLLSEITLVGKLSASLVEKIALDCVAFEKQVFQTKVATGELGPVLRKDDEGEEERENQLHPEKPWLSAEHLGLTDESQVKSVVACVGALLRNAAKYNVDREDLVTELSQMGLERSICEAISSTASLFRSELRTILREESLRMTRQDRNRPIAWRSNLVVSSRLSRGELTKVVEMSIPILDYTKRAGEPVKRSIRLEAEETKLRLMYEELRKAREVMARFEKASFPSF